MVRTGLLQLGQLSQHPLSQQAIGVGRLCLLYTLSALLKTHGLGIGAAANPKPLTKDTTTHET